MTAGERGTYGRMQPMERFLIVVAGKAGSGKTTLSKKLAALLGLPYFDYDTLVQPFLEAIEHKYGIGDDGRNRFYRSWRSASYRTLWDVVLENIRLGRSAVMSAPLSEELRDADWPGKLFAKSGTRFSLLLCYMAPPPDMHYTMLARRASKRDSDVLGDREKFDAQYAAQKPAWDKNCVLLLDSGDIDTNTKLVLQAIEERNFKIGES